MDRLEEGLARYWSKLRPDARDVAIADLSQFHGGASRETFRVRIEYASEAAPKTERSLIVRVMPEGCLLSSEVSRLETEFRAMNAVHGTGVPVPEPVALESDPAWIGAPFMLVEALEGCESSATGLTREPASRHLEGIGQRFWQGLGTLAGLDPEARGLTDYLEAPEPGRCWERELAVWEKEAARHAWPPLPVFEAGLRWLRAHPPPPAQKISIVHGDYRAGNFLYDAEGEIKGILDWELCHLGDPLEDIAWAMLPSWSGGEERPGRMIPRDRAISIWEETSGLKVDPEALFWWEVFGNVKLVVPMANAGIEYREGRNANPQLVVAAWYALNTALSALADRLAGRI